MLNTVFKFTKVAEIVIGKHWKTLSHARAGVATAYLIYKTVHRNEFFWDQSIYMNEFLRKCLDSQILC